MLIVEYSCFEIHSLASVSLLCFLRIQKESIPWYKKYIVVTVWNVWYSINKYQTILKIEKYMSDCFTFLCQCHYWYLQNLLRLLVVLCRTKPDPLKSTNRISQPTLYLNHNWRKCYCIKACSKHCMKAQKGLTGWQNNIEWNTAQVTIVNVFNYTD